MLKYTFMIRVLIADSSHIVKKLIRECLETDPEINVIGLADSGEEAYKKILELIPDIVLLDFNLPQHNTLESLKMITNKLSKD